ncbi:MAG: hypothetical protein RLY16_1133 [Bacteroidota bacterium]
MLRAQDSSANSRLLIGKFKSLVQVLPVDSRTIDLAIVSDFEDAIQYACAIENNLETIITRNIKNYKKATISVFTPELFLSLLQQ